MTEILLRTASYRDRNFSEAELERGDGCTVVIDLDRIYYANLPEDQDDGSGLPSWANQEILWLNNLGQMMRISEHRLDYANRCLVRDHLRERARLENTSVLREGKISRRNNTAGFLFLDLTRLRLLHCAAPTTEPNACASQARRKARETFFPKGDSVYAFFESDMRGRPIPGNPDLLQEIRGIIESHLGDRYHVASDYYLTIFQHDLVEAISIAAENVTITLKHGLGFDPKIYTTAGAIVGGVKPLTIGLYCAFEQFFLKPRRIEAISVIQDEDLDYTVKVTCAHPNRIEKLTRTKALAIYRRLVKAGELLEILDGDCPVAISPRSNRLISLEKTLNRHDRRPAEYLNAGTLHCRLENGESAQIIDKAAKRGYICLNDTDEPIRLLSTAKESLVGMLLRDAGDHLDISVFGGMTQKTRKKTSGLILEAARWQGLHPFVLGNHGVIVNLFSLLEIVYCPRRKHVEIFSREKDGVSWASTIDNISEDHGREFVRHFAVKAKLAQVNQNHAIKPDCAQSVLTINRKTYLLGFPLTDPSNSVSKRTAKAILAQRLDGMPVAAGVFAAT